MARTPQVTSVFSAMVQPPRFIKPNRMGDLADLLSNPKACEEFIEDRDASKIIGCLESAATPESKKVIKAILLNSRHEGALGGNFDGNRFCTVRLLGLLDQADQKEVLQKRWMIPDLLDAESYHWNGKEVMALLGSFSKEDRFDILNTPFALYGLITRKADKVETNREKVLEWLADYTDEQNAELFSKDWAARTMIEAYGQQGIDMVKDLMPYEKYASLFASPNEERTNTFAFVWLDTGSLTAYLNSLNVEDREKFCAQEKPFVVSGLYNQRSLPVMDADTRQVSLRVLSL